MTVPEPHRLPVAPSCLAAWKEALDGGDDTFHALEMATIAVEDYCVEHHIDRGKVACREVAVIALGLTPAELQSIEPWCPGHGDDEECEITETDDSPCGGCRDAGYRQENGPLTGDPETEQA